MRLLAALLALLALAWRMGANVPMDADDDLVRRFREGGVL